MLAANLAVPLLSQDATDISLYGAKSATLSKATQHGFSVPKGIAVSRECTINDFAFIAQSILDDLSLPVAVRSSAIAEDNLNQSFAGQFETRLGIRSIDDLINAYAIVKNSGATSHIEKYKGGIISPEEIAVLVQFIPNVTRAGVAFSKDPVTGESKCLIDSSYGLGQSVAGGYVIPDSIEYYNDGTYKTYIGRKSTQILLTDDGISEQSTFAEDSQRCSLTAEEIIEVALLAQNTERELGFTGVDIEWAYDDTGKLWLLQARPITTI